MAQTEPDPYWGGHFIGRLTEAGVLPENTQRVVITADCEEFVTFVAEFHPKTGELVDMLQGYIFKGLD